MFAAITTGMITRIAGARRRFTVASTIGVTKMTVVTLSTNAEAIAVNHQSTAIARAGCPPKRSSSRSTAHANTPVSLSTPTSAIIAASRRSTLMSRACAVDSSVSRRYGVR